uniref:Uncharacterized protein n=1 Tax=Chlamydomonas euryale TaxID=1486919 RepID=A0A7R9Z2K3_9CHLO|mmetsp:Transcript_40669/g.121291  ORF Transcript_40669/g.121291 Transcript_40669/m.121291 type:complete len:241 (+) Transcript_40669:243-965(+)
MVKCGAQPVFYQYPAWSFGTKRTDYGDSDLDGPGPAATNAKSTMGSTGPVYGPRRMGARTERGPYGDGYMADGAHYKPGYLSQEPRAPAYGFGTRPKTSPEDGPSPQDYTFNASWAAKTSSWGPPPRTLRKAAGPQVMVTRPAVTLAKGPTFGLPYTSRIDVTPGPLDYQCHCGNGCCKACDTYAGVSFKGKLPQMYGKVTTKTPGPAAYHTECSTIGVATAHCTTDGTQSTSLRSRRRS